MSLKSDPYVRHHGLTRCHPRSRPTDQLQRASRYDLARAFAVVGGIGASGGSIAQDIDVATAGLAAIQH
jgi:hypothetical protein